MLYKYGKIKREGAGLSFFYYGPTSTIVAVPIASIDMPFVFQEATADFQTVSIQGQFTYRVANPKQLASLLDFSVDNRRAYTSDDPRKLPVLGEQQLALLHHRCQPLLVCPGSLKKRLNGEGRVDHLDQTRPFSRCGGAKVKRSG